MTDVTAKFGKPGKFGVRVWFTHAGIRGDAKVEVQAENIMDAVDKAYALVKLSFSEGCVVTKSEAKRLRDKS